VSPSSIVIFSAGTPISLARIWAKVVAWPWPWLIVPSLAMMLPAGCTRISHESNMPRPRMSQFLLGPAPTISVKKLTPIPISLRVSPRGCRPACQAGGAPIFCVSGLEGDTHSARYLKGILECLFLAPVPTLLARFRPC